MTFEICTFLSIILKIKKDKIEIQQNFDPLDGIDPVASLLLAAAVASRIKSLGLMLFMVSLMVCMPEKVRQMIGLVYK